MARKNNSEVCPNSPNVVRNSLLTYIKEDFPYQKNWKHPVTDDEFTSSFIHEKLLQLKTLNPQAYKALWILFTTSANRNFVACRLLISTSTLRRIWDRGLDTLLLMLVFDDLDPGFLEMYES